MTIRKVNSWLIFITLAILLVSRLSSEDIYVNIGGGRYVYDDRIFLEDQPFSPEGGWGYIGGLARDYNYICLVGTEWIDVYHTYRLGGRYEFELDAGDYLLEFYYVEMEAHWYDQSRIRFTANGEPLCGYFDPWAHSGREYPQLHSFYYRHDGGRLELDIESEGFPPVLHGLGVSSLDIESNYAFTPIGFEVRNGHNEMILYWKDSYNRGLRGYILEYRGGDGIWREYPDTLFHTTLRLPDSEGGDFRLSSIDVLGNRSEPTAIMSGAPIGWESELLVYHIHIDEEALERLHIEPDSEEYLTASLGIGDSIFLPSIGIRLRGHSNRYRQKKSYKLLIRGPAWHGRQKFNLIAMWHDAALAKDAVTYTLSRRNGADTPEMQYVIVNINGRNMGVYLDVEQLDEKYLENRGYPEDDMLFKAITGALYSEREAEDMIGRWERETGDEDDLSPLYDFIYTLNSPEGADVFRVMDSLIDLNSLYLWWSTQLIVANADFYSGNHYLRRDSRTCKWHFIPWDNDDSFRYPDMEMRLGLYDRDGTERLMKNRIFERFWEQPELRDRLFDEVNASIDRFITSGVAENLIDSLHWLIDEEVPLDVDRIYRGRTGSFFYSNTSMKNLLHERQLYLQDRMTEYAHTLAGLQIVELSAGSDYVDEAGEADPWLELHNGTSDTQFMIGWTLTDDPRDPTKWRLPYIRLEAGERKILWMDGQPEQGRFHSPFELATPRLYLFSVDGLIVDALDFTGTLSEGRTIVRYPEASNNIVHTVYPTPGEANTSRGSEPIGRPVHRSLSVSPNPFNSSCMFEGVRDRLSIVDVRGRIVDDIDLGEGTSYLWQPPKGVNSGIYLARSNGKMVKLVYVQ